jgi:hypothetical protein
MIALFLVAVAGAAATMSQQTLAPISSENQQPLAPISSENPKPSIKDPQLGAVETDGPAWLYPMLRQEPRDAQWAPNAERALRNRYSRITFFGMKPSLLRVTCARTTS